MDDCATVSSASRLPERETGLSRRDHHVAKQRESLPATVVYTVVSREGEQELERPAGSLFWSGIAAGVALYTSVIATALLRRELGGVPAGNVVAHLGYAVGFLIVVLGRLQLFTEATITAVLPVVAHPSPARVLRTARLWGIVFGANLIGMFFVAAITVFMGSDVLLGAVVELSRPLLDKSWISTAAAGAPAGFLVAAMVWMLPSAQGSKFWVVVTMTSVISLGHFAHVVAGSGEVFVLWLSGATTFGQATLGFILPALIGNIAGGTGLFALLAYAQVRDEL